MNQILLIALLGAACAFAQINPSSEEDILLPSQFTHTQWAGGLVNMNGGVAYAEEHGEGYFGVNLFSFGVVDEFGFSNESLWIDGCVPQLINLADDVDSFLVFCVDPTQGSNPEWAMLQINSSADGSLSVVRNTTFVVDDAGMDFVEVFPSASAFVTAQGNVYLGVQVADDSGNNNISIVEFDVSTFNIVYKINDLLAQVFGSEQETQYYLKDLHSLPFDEGVAVILNPLHDFDQQDNSTGQVFAFVFFNGTVVIRTVPNGQELDYVGRHRGSSFAYTMGDANQLPYVDVYAWDLSNLQNTNNVQTKGYVSERFNSHFATSEEVFYFADTQQRHGPERSEGSLNQLPYSEFGFLPNSVNSMTVNIAPFGDLLDGVDGTYIYSFTTSSTDGQFYLSRWTY